MNVADRIELLHLMKNIAQKAVGVEQLHDTQATIIKTVSKDWDRVWELLEEEEKDYKQLFIKAHAFECLLQHLENVENDPRRREQARAKIALRTIDKWIQSGERAYEQR